MQTPSAGRNLIAAIMLLSLIFANAGTVAAQSADGSRKPDRDGRYLDICQPIDRADLKHRNVFRYGVSGESLQDDFYNKEHGYNSEGYRPVRITGYMDGDNIRFATRWVQDGGPGWYSWFGMKGESFHQEYLNLRDTHMPVDVSGYNTPDGVRYNVVWEKNVDNVDWKVKRDVSRPGMQTLVDQFKQSGYGPTRVEGYLIDGDLRFISTWVRIPDGCRWMMHNQMTRQEYQDKLNLYANSMRLTHLDSYNFKGEVYYAGIWVAQPGPGQEVRSNRDWYLFQRLINNKWCEGAVLENFHATTIDDTTVRFGGIWTTADPPQTDGTSSLASRLRQEVDCADGRAGAAVINLTTGEEVMLHADQSFGTASVIKIGILYSLARMADDQGIDLTTTTLNSGAQYGQNQGNLMVANTDYRLDFLARIMISNSNNWATNRLIDFIGMETINQDLDDLGLSRIRLRRYMTGSGSPGIDGNAGAGSDFSAGIDNTSTPRQMATLLQLIHENDGLLSTGAYNFFWDTMGIASTSKGNAVGLLATGVDPNWTLLASFAQKPGRNTYGYDAIGNPTASPGDYLTVPQVGSHIVLTEAGRIVFDGGDIVFFAIFINEADGPNPGTMPATISCFGMEIVREYSGQTTGIEPPQCQ